MDGMPSRKTHNLTRTQDARGSPLGLTHLLPVEHAESLVGERYVLSWRVGMEYG